MQEASYIPLTITFDPITKILQPVVNSGATWTNACSTEDKDCLIIMETTNRKKETAFSTHETRL